MATTITDRDLLTGVNLTGISVTTMVLQRRLEELPDDHERVQYLCDLVTLIEEEADVLAERIRRPEREAKRGAAAKRLGVERPQRRPKLRAV